MKNFIYGKSGVYALFDGATCVYVGQSINLYERLRTHHGCSSRFFDRWQFMPVPCHSLHIYEAVAIKELQPTGNTHKPPVWLNVTLDWSFRFQRNEIFCVSGVGTWGVFPHE